MSKGDPRYVVEPRRVLFSERGTELKIKPLLEGIRGLSGEKIQRYLAWSCAFVFAIHRFV